MGRPKSEDKKRRIMKAAESLFASRRFHESTLDDVAKTAKVGKGTIYRYFRDKDDLFFQTAAAEFDDLCDLIAARAPAGLAFGDRVLRTLHAISGFMQDRRQVFGLGEADERRLAWCKGTKTERWVARRRRLVAAVSSVLEQGRAEGRIRTDMNMEAMASMLLGMLRTRAMRGREGLETLTLEKTADLFLLGAAFNARSSAFEPPANAGSRPKRTRHS